MVTLQSVSEDDLKRTVPGVWYNDAIIDGFLARVTAELVCMLEP